MVLSLFIPRIVFHCVLVLIIHIRNFTECNIPFTEKTEIVASDFLYVNEDIGKD